MDNIAVYTNHPKVSVAETVPPGLSLDQCLMLVHVLLNHFSNLRIEAVKIKTR